MLKISILFITTLSLLFYKSAIAQEQPTGQILQNQIPQDKQLGNGQGPQATQMDALQQESMNRIDIGRGTHEIQPLQGNLHNNGQQIPISETILRDLHPQYKSQEELLGSSKEIRQFAHQQIIVPNRNPQQYCWNEGQYLFGVPEICLIWISGGLSDNKDPLLSAQLLLQTIDYLSNLVVQEKSVPIQGAEGQYSNLPQVQPNLENPIPLNNPTQNLN